MNHPTNPLLREAQRTVFKLGILCLCLLMLFSAKIDVFSLIYTAFSFMFVAVPVLLFALLGWHGKRFQQAATVSLLSSLMWCSISSISLILVINYHLQSEQFTEVLAWYRWLYVNPVIIFIIGVFAFVTHVFLEAKRG